MPVGNYIYPEECEKKYKVNRIEASGKAFFAFLTDSLEPIVT